MEDRQEHDDLVRQRMLSRTEFDPESGCWRYRGATTGNGYGHVRYGNGTEYAHRLAAMFFLGFDTATGLQVLHRCDQPECLNPQHLYIGTQRENMQDAARKGRMTGKKLTAEKVARIKYRLTQGETQRALSLAYGVSTTAIGQIARGETWKTVEPSSDQGEDLTSERA